jgi:glycosyltransferase involved in cell wall biosynthesis
MKKLKVAHIITKLELGGAQQNTLYTVSHLNKERFEPVLITGEGGILDDDARKLTGVEVIFVPGLVRSIVPIFDFTAFWRLYKILRRIKPDIVHTHSSKAGILGRWAAWFAKVPAIIHTFHGFGFHDFQHPITRWLYVAIEKITAPVTNKFIVVAADNIDKALKEGIGKRENYLVIHSGIDTKKYKTPVANKAAKRAELGLKPEDKAVTTIGPFKPQKNLPDFFKAAAIIARQNPKAVFLVVGDGALRPQFESQIKDLELTEKVKLLSWRRDTAELLAISDIFVMTSLWEGLPRAILEAMCAGIPVVANNVDGVNEVVQNGITGYLTTPNQPQQTALKVIELLANPDITKSMGLAGKTAITEDFDINQMIIQQESLYTHSKEKTK